MKIKENEDETTQETHGVIDVPSDPMRAPQVYYLENKGPPPCPSYSEEFIHQYGTSGCYWAFRLLEGPTTFIHHYLAPCGACFYIMS